MVSLSVKVIYPKIIKKKIFREKMPLVLCKKDTTDEGELQMELVHLYNASSKH